MSAPADVRRDAVPVPGRIVRADAPACAGAQAEAGPERRLPRPAVPFDPFALPAEDAR